MVVLGVDAHRKSHSIVAVDEAGAQPASITVSATMRVIMAFAPGVAPLQALPLAAIVIPEPSQTTADVDVQVVSPIDALFAMLAFPRVHHWRRPDVLSREFSTLSGLVNTVPVYKATIPWGPPFRRAIAPAIAALVER